MAPKVSICIPVYNRALLLRSTLWSVLRQSLQDFEIIVSDNASEEDVRAEIARVGDPRIRYVRLASNLGAAGNFRHLETLAQGEYVLFLCSDDLLLPDCLARAVEVLDSQPSRGAAVYRAAHYEEHGFKFFSSMPDRPHATAAEYMADAAVRDFRFASPSLCLYRRSTFELLGGWHPRLLAVIDWELYSRVIRDGGGVVFIHHVLAIMRLDGDRLSNTTALHWDFYHDVMWLGMQPEHNWSGSYMAMALVDQLLWDFRLRRSPLNTIRHAYRVKALPKALAFTPAELARRVGLKVRAALGRPSVEAVTPLRNSVSVNQESLDAFWSASQAVRYQ